MLRLLARGNQFQSKVFSGLVASEYIEVDNNFDWQPLTLWKWKRLLPKSGGPLGACALSRSTLSHIFYSQFHSKIRQVLLGVNLKPFRQQSKLTTVKTQKSIGRVFLGKGDISYYPASGKGSQLICEQQCNTTSVRFPSKASAVQLGQIQEQYCHRGYVVLISTADAYDCI